MSQQIVYIDTSEIREGKLEDLKLAMKALVLFVEAHMPQLISYGFFLNQDQSRMTVVAIHPDSASLENHLDVGANEFKKFTELIDLLKIEVYGPISDAAHERLQQKARMLGSRSLTVHDFYTGFAR